MIMENDKVYNVPEMLLDEKAKQKLCSIRFDAIVRMYDTGSKELKMPWPLQPKPLPPQWFAIESQLTMEMIANADPYILGTQLKEMYRKLDFAIRQYEGKSPL
jgi:hypothetical protein